MLKLVYTYMYEKKSENLVQQPHKLFDICGCVGAFG